MLGNISNEKPYIGNANLNLQSFPWPYFVVVHLQNDNKRFKIFKTKIKTKLTISTAVAACSALKKVIKQ